MTQYKTIKRDAAKLSYMQRSNRWRHKRRYERYRRISEKLDDGMYALALLKAFEDDEIEFTLEDREDDIKTRLENCAVLLDDMYRTAMDASTGSLEQQTLIDDLDLTPDELSNLLVTIEATLNHFECPSNFKETYDTLRDIETAAMQKAKLHQT